MGIESAGVEVKRSRLHSRGPTCVYSWPQYTLVSSGRAASLERDDHIFQQSDSSHDWLRMTQVENRPLEFYIIPLLVASIRTDSLWRKENLQNRGRWTPLGARLHCIAHRQLQPGCMARVGCMHREGSPMHGQSREGALLGMMLEMGQFSRAVRAARMDDRRLKRVHGSWSMRLRGKWVLRVHGMRHTRLHGQWASWLHGTWFGSPSNKRPHPSENSVSPVNTAPADGM